MIRDSCAERRWLLRTEQLRALADADNKAKINARIAIEYLVGIVISSCSLDVKEANCRWFCSASLVRLLQTPARR
jgi:hypothetical protein